MALTLKYKDGIWYWWDGNSSDATLPAALYGIVDHVFLPGALTQLRPPPMLCVRAA